MNTYVHCSSTRSIETLQSRLARHFEEIFEPVPIHLIDVPAKVPPTTVVRGSKPEKAKQ